MSQGKNYIVWFVNPQNTAKITRNYRILFSQYILVIRLNTDDTDQGRIQNSVKHLRCLRGF